MKNCSLYSRFKKEYEEGTNLKIAWSNIDKDGNLTVGIKDKEGNERFYLNVTENEKGQIIWY